MDKFKITGGKKLSGSVEIDGAKNSVLPLLAACLLIDKGKAVIHNIPNLMDIHTLVAVMEHLGAKVNYYQEERRIEVNSENLTSYEAPYDLVRKMRASFLVLGPLLARLGKAKVSLPGGCTLGQRPVDLHIKGFARLGAGIEEKEGYVMASCSKLNGNYIYFDRPSHTGTENLIMGATLGEGETVLINAACDPEVVDLADFLNKAGAEISGAGTTEIRIKGVKKLSQVEHIPIPDRLEAATFMMAAAITGGEVNLKNSCPDHLNMVSLKLEEMGCEIKAAQKELTVKGPKKLAPVRVTTYPHPGFPTDMQPSLMALATVAEGTSHIRETVFDNRFTCALELARLGADITISGDEANIRGVPKLSGTKVMASDIRAGAALVLAALAAEGDSEILRVYHIDRGYDHLEKKLAHLGASISRVGE